MLIKYLDTKQAKAKHRGIAPSLTRETLHVLCEGLERCSKVLTELLAAFECECEHGGGLPKASGAWQRATTLLDELKPEEEEG